MELRGRWWNGSFGTMTRRDIFLRERVVWEVETRQGGSEGSSDVRQFRSEQEARQFVKRCMDGAPQWRDLTHHADKPTPEAER